MSYKPGDTYHGEFCTSNPGTAAAQNADSAPTATMVRNGSDDGTVTLTVTNITTGRYAISGTIPSGYAAGDACQVAVNATVNSIAGAAIIDSFVLDSKRLADVTSGSGVVVTTNNDKSNYSLSQSFPTNFASLAITSGGAITVGTNNDKSNYSLSQSFPTNFASLSIDSSGRVKALDSSGNAYTYTTPPTTSQIAAAILVTPANLLTTDSSGRVTVGSNADKSGYSLSQAFPTNFASLAVSGSGYVTVGTNNDKTGYALTTAPPTTSQIAAVILATPGNLLETDAMGRVSALDSGNNAFNYTTPPTSAAIASAVMNDVSDTVGSDVVAIKTQTDKLLFDGSNYVKSDPQTALTLAANALDNILLESGISASTALTNDSGTQLTQINLRQGLALMQAILAGMLSNVGGNAPIFRATGKPAVTRLEGVADTAGDRTAITITVPD